MGLKADHSKRQRTPQSNESKQFATLTYWQANVLANRQNNIPDVIDFCITKGIDTKKCKVETCLDLSSDHSIVMLTVYSQILNKEKQPSLHNSKTDWDAFREKLDSLISLN
jgi:hypothetical protein